MMRFLVRGSSVFKDLQYKQYFCGSCFAPKKGLNEGISREVCILYHDLVQQFPYERVLCSLLYEQILPHLIILYCEVQGTCDTNDMGKIVSIILVLGLQTFSVRVKSSNFVDIVQPLKQNVNSQVLRTYFFGGKNNICLVKKIEPLKDRTYVQRALCAQLLHVAFSCQGVGKCLP